MGRLSLWEGHIFWEGGVDSGRAGWILVASHRPIVVEKGGIFWKEWVDYGNVAYSYKKGGIYSGRKGWILGGSHICLKRGGIFRERCVDSGRVA